MSKHYAYRLISDKESTRWEIYTGHHLSPSVVFAHPYRPEEESGNAEPPEPIRKEYERLIGRTSVRPEKAFDQPDSAANVVEMIASDDGGFDQVCAYGNRVESHAVYCHNEWWLYAPRKCRRTWYTGGERRDEDCPGFMPRVPPEPSN